MSETLSQTNMSVVVVSLGVLFQQHSPQSYIYTTHISFLFLLNILSQLWVTQDKIKFLEKSS